MTSERRAPVAHGSPLDEEETLDRAGLRDVQTRKLEALLEHVQARSAFYQAKWATAGLPRAFTLDRLSELERLPFTTKRELLDDQQAAPPFGSILTEKPARYTRLHQTSGTTDRPLRWLDTSASWQWWLRCWHRVYKAAGVTPSDRVFVPFSFGPFIGFWSAFEAAAELGALVVPGGGQDSAQRGMTLLDSAATVLVSTPSYAIHLARTMRQRGLDPAASAIRRTIHAGEPGASIPNTRAQLSRLWGAEPFDHYGLTEVGAVAFGCLAEAPGLHVNEAEFIAEVIDPATGAPHSHGRGELVLTNLGRFGSPVIRYRTGDIVDLARDPCPCGRNFARLTGGVLGRSDDMLVVRGVNVFPSMIEDAVRAHPLVDEFQIQLRQEGDLQQLRIVLEVDQRAYSQQAILHAQNTIAERVHQSCSLRVTAAIVPTGTLPRQELKAKRVVRVG